MGYTVDFGYDFRLSKGTYFGLKLTLNSGLVDLGYRDANGKKQMESLSSLDIGVGLRF